MTKKSYVQYKKGTLPIILSAPHGGDKCPKNIKNRKTGIFEKDDYTLELTHEILKEFKKQTSRYPHCITSTISRKKVDLNRDQDEAYECENAHSVYKKFHNKIEHSRDIVKKDFKKGLYFDIHGQSHPEGFVEFGYLLDNSILKKQKLKRYRYISSIKKLSHFSHKSFNKQIRGKNSIGSIMEKNGYKSIPSKNNPFAKDENYFEGAYNTLRYGHHKSDEISAIQVEFPYKKCRDSKKNRKKCAKAFVKAIIKFTKVHLNIDLKNINYS